MRATRAYLAGFGTSGSLVAGAALVFLLASAIVAFRGWPQVAAPPAPAAVSVPQLAASATSRASRVLLSAAAGHATAGALRRGTRTAAVSLGQGGIGGGPDLTAASGSLQISTGGSFGGTPTPGGHDCAGSTCGQPTPAPSGQPLPVPQPVQQAVSQLTSSAQATAKSVVGTVKKHLPAHVPGHGTAGGTVRTVVGTVTHALGTTVP